MDLGESCNNILVVFVHCECNMSFTCSVDRTLLHGW
jgi:hypothetical protein